MSENPVHPNDAPRLSLGRRAGGLSCRGGFTLVEILVVFLVISILIAIMFPVQQKIVHSSRSTRCVSNLRQIHDVICLYMMDHNNCFPPANAQNKMGGDWSGIWYAPAKPTTGTNHSPVSYVGGQAAMDKLVVCPENLGPVPASLYNPFGYPYCVNYNVMVAASYAPKRSSMIFRPSNTVLMIDSATGKTPGLKWNLGFNSTTSGWTAVENCHQGRLNALWVDGHVSAMRKEDITDKMLTNPIQ